MVSALTDPEFKKRSSEGFDITRCEKAGKIRLSLQLIFFRHDLCSLTGLRWLNDQVINAGNTSLVSKPGDPSVSIIGGGKVQERHLQRGARVRGRLALVILGFVQLLDGLRLLRDV